MSRTRFFVTLLLAASLVFVSIGYQQAAAQENGTWLQVVHLAPFAEDAGVTITLNDTPALTDFAYGNSTGYIDLTAGTYDVAVIPTGASDPAIEATVTLQADTYYTVIAVGDGVNQDLDLILLEDDLTEPAEGMFHLRLGHLAPFAAGAATADIRLQDGTPVLLDVDFGDVTGFMPLEAGEYDLKITTPGGEVTLIDPLPVTFTEGTIISAFASGDGMNQDLGVFALPAGEEGFFLPLQGEVEYKLFLPLMLKNSRTAEAGLRVVHASPDAPAVDVWLNDSIAISSLAFGESSGYANLPAGEYNVVVVPAGAVEPRVIEATLTLSAGQNYTVAAVGLLADIAPLVSVDNISSPADGMSHVRFGHLSPDAPAVDIALTGGDVLFPGAAFRDIAEYMPVPAGSYDLEVRLAGTDTVVLPLPGIIFEEGKVYTVFAIGLAAGEPPLQAVIFVDHE
jgi:hypothetical protein